VQNQTGPLPKVQIASRTVTKSEKRTRTREFLGGIGEVLLHYDSRGFQACFETADMLFCRLTIAGSVAGNRYSFVLPNYREETRLGQELF
jgi:hypothetical protein